ncbi:hypothetical protein [Peribacillus simplex]|uniref:hypothetical protein n=1 Tax=Peribacillus simplex TaxID=1478 RepID=UPI0024C14AB7|nr:hypothetical protein [Peribacillus simplex]WHY58564.1 hypothetical protein QNH43_10040 [Peribacillus simplex]
MNNQDYFNDENYTGNHLHVDNWKYEFTPYIEAIAWVRKDSPMDLFFNDFADDKEFQALFSDKEYYYNELMGVFFGNVKTNQEVYEMFRNWVDGVLYPFRKRAK